MKPKAAYASMVSEIDKNVGQIIQLLKEKGILENTIIIFSSDNGVHCVGGHEPDFLIAMDHIVDIKETCMKEEYGHRLLSVGQR